MWIVLFNALDDFGIKEINDVVRMGASQTSAANYGLIDDLKRKLANEALNSALRISALVCGHFEPVVFAKQTTL